VVHPGTSQVLFASIETLFVQVSTVSRYARRNVFQR
jgi:hypothetical protein